MADNFTTLLPVANTVDELLGNKDGETVRIPRAQVTNSASPSDIIAVSERTTVLESAIAPTARSMYGGANIASASTIDLGAATGDYAAVTGTTAIGSLGIANAGIERTVYFTGVLVLSVAGGLIVLPGGADITTAPGDVAVFRSHGGGVWRCVSYVRANGTPLVPDATAASLAVALAGPSVRVIGSLMPTISGGGVASNYSFAQNDPTPGPWTLREYRCYVATIGSGTFYLRRSTRSGSTFTTLQSVALTVTSTGWKTFTAADFGVFGGAAGEYYGIYQPTGGAQIAGNSTGTDGGGYYQGAGGATAPVTMSLAVAGYRLDWLWTLDISNTLPAPGDYGQTQAAAIKGKIAYDLLVGTTTTIIGRSSTPVSGNGSVANYIFIANDPIPQAGSTEFAAWFTGSGYVWAVACSRSGSPGAYVFTPLRATPLTIVDGWNDFSSLAMAVNAGEFVGIYQPSGGPRIQGAALASEGAGYVQASGWAATYSNPTLVTAYRIEWQWSVTYLTGVGPTEIAGLTASVASINTKLVSTPALLCYGDSMTFGAGGGASPYPTQLGNLLGRVASNLGVSAQRTYDIFARWGSYPILVPSLTIPASGSIDFDMPIAWGRANPLISSNSAVTFAGTLAGVPCVLSYVSAGSGYYTYRLTRTGSGSAVAVLANEPFLIDLADGRNSATPIFWAGRNSIGLQETSGQSSQEQFDKFFTWHERAIQFLKPVDKHFIVMGPSNRNDEYPGSTTTVAGAALNGDQSYSLIVAIAAEMRQRWPRNFVNQRAIVVAAYNASNSTDVADFAADRTPTSLRSDSLHYNIAGYGKVAATLRDRIVLLGY